MEEVIKLNALGMMALYGGEARNPLFTFHYQGKSFLYVGTANPVGDIVGKYVMTQEKKQDMEKGTNEQLSSVIISSLFHSLKGCIDTYEDT